MLTQQQAVDLFAECVTILSELGPLFEKYINPADDEKLLEQIEEAYSKVKALSTHPMERNEHDISKTSGEVYLLVNLSVVGAAACVIHVKAGYWHPSEEHAGFVDESTVGVLDMRVPRIVGARYTIERTNDGSGAAVTARIGSETHEFKIEFATSMSDEALDSMVRAAIRDRLNP